MPENAKKIIDDWTQRVLWALMVALFSYGVSEVKGISQSLQHLNTSVMLLSEKLNVASENSKEYSKKFEALESLVFRMEKEVLFCNAKLTDHINMDAKK